MTNIAKRGRNEVEIADANRIGLKFLAELIGSSQTTWILSPL